MATSELFSSDSSLDKEHPFCDAAVSFAVDVSGSTAGRVLRVEQMFVAKVAKLLSATSQLTAKVLPWSDRSLGVVDLGGAERLRSYGYTTPHAILEDTAAREALGKSSLWFLMTDGEVDERPRTHFVRLLPKTGVHGTSCVTVIFGTTTQSPAQCNISVGVNVFAVVPDCLFLYCDTQSGEVVVLGSKGIFSSVLGDGVEIPVIDDDTTWASLPRFSFSSLVGLKIPAVRKLGKDQIALQDGLVIDFDDLYKGRLAQDKIDRIFASDANLDSLTMTTQSRNQQAQWGAWLQQQHVSARSRHQQALAVPRHRPRPDIAGAAAAFKRLIASTSAGRSPGDTDFWPSADLDMMRKRLRAANAGNMRCFLKACQREVDGLVFQQSQIAQSARKAASTSVTNSRALNSIRHYKMAPSDYQQSQQQSRQQYQQAQQAQQQYQQAQQQQQQATTGFAQPAPRPPQQTHSAPLPIINDPEAWGNWDGEITDDNLRHLLYTPGFTSAHGAYRGTCSLCLAENMVLAWLLRTPTSQQSLELYRVPALGCGAAIANFRPLLTALVCEPCSTWCRDTGKSPDKEDKVAVALPMVDVDGNAAAYAGVLGAFFPQPDGREGQNLRLQAWLSVLLEMEHGVVKSVNAGAAGVNGSEAFHAPGTSDAAAAALASATTYLDAIRWTVTRLLPAIQLPTAFIRPGPASPNHNLPLSDILHQAFRSTRLDLGGLLPPSPVMRVSLPEAVTLLRAAAAHDVGGVSNVTGRRAYAFWRLMAEVAAHAGKAGREETLGSLQAVLWRDGPPETTTATTTALPDQQQQQPASPALTATTTSATMIEGSEADDDDGMDDDDDDMVMVSVPGHSRASSTSAESGQLVSISAWPGAAAPTTAPPPATTGAAAEAERALPIRTRDPEVAATKTADDHQRRPVLALAPAALVGTGILPAPVAASLAQVGPADFDFVLAPPPAGEAELDASGFLLWTHGAAAAFCHAMLRVLREDDAAAKAGTPLAGSDLFARTLALAPLEAIRGNVVKVGGDMDAVRGIVDAIAAGN